MQARHLAILAVFAALAILPAARADCSFDNVTIQSLSNATNVSELSIYQLLQGGCTQSLGLAYTKGETDILINNSRQFSIDRIDALNFSQRVDDQINSRFTAFMDNLSAFWEDKLQTTQLLEGLLQVSNASTRIDSEVNRLDNERGIQLVAVDGRLNTLEANYNALTSTINSSPKLNDYLLPIGALAVVAGLFLWNRKGGRIPFLPHRPTPQIGIPIQQFDAGNLDIQRRRALRVTPPVDLDKELVRARKQQIEESDHLRRKVLDAKRKRKEKVDI